MEINERASAIKKQQHDLIRRLEHKEILIDEYNERFHKLQLELDKVDITKPTIQQGRESETRSPHEAETVGATPTPAINKCRGRPVKNDKQYILKILMENDGKTLNELSYHLGKHIDVSKDSAKIYILRFIKSLPPEYYFDKPNYKVYKKSDLIDPNGRPIS